jgi:hypothetical protein
MPYRATGMDRDSYITGNRPPGFAGAVNIHARRDTLPDNVFNYLKDQVAREQFEAFIYENQKANNQLISGKRGRRILQGGETAEQAEEKQLARTEKAAFRSVLLKELYESELRQWESELNAKGLALERPDK